MNTLKRLTELNRISLGKAVDEVHSPEEAGEVFQRLATESAFPIVQFDWGKLS